MVRCSRCKGEYNRSLKDLVAILDPQSRSKVSKMAAEPEKDTRKPRKLKTYKNPQGGETIQTKGGNHTTLKAWKVEHGAETVEGWRN